MMSQYGGFSNYGGSMAKSQSNFNTAPGRKSAPGGSRPKKVVYKGRKITLEECKFVFDRVWKATLDCGDELAKEDVPEDHVHPKDRENNIIMVDDLFHVVDLTGQLLNKAEPAEDSTAPYDEFLKHAVTQMITDNDGQNPHIVQFVPVEEMPKVIFGIFAGQVDKKRLDAA